MFGLALAQPGNSCCSGSNSIWTLELPPRYWSGVVDARECRHEEAGCKGTGRQVLGGGVGREEAWGEGSGGG